MSEDDWEIRVGQEAISVKLAGYGYDAFELRDPDQLERFITELRRAAAKAWGNPRRMLP